MKLSAGAILFGAFGILIIAAVIILSIRPMEVMPMHPDNNYQNQNVAGKDDLPILAPAIPNFIGISKWWNTPDGKPLTPESLQGKVVLVDFWTYSCINCIRTQPVLKTWWNAYKDDGLVIVGVHTPEFAFEKVPANVEAAFKKAGLEYPIALDDEYGTWNTYSNQYWPAGYFFDRQGRLRFVHFGEGNYDEQEKVIRTLLAEGTTLNEPETHADNTPMMNKAQTPETYFGSLRAERQNKDYSAVLGDNQWSVNGTWNTLGERIESQRAGNQFKMNFNSNAFYLVLGSTDGAKRIKITVDGQETQTISVKDKQLYTIAEFPEPGKHTVELQILDAGVQFYSATFGK